MSFLKDVRFGSGVVSKKEIKNMKKKGFNVTKIKPINEKEFIVVGALINGDNKNLIH